MKTRSALGLATGAALLVLGLSPPAAAQTPPVHSFEQLQIKPGQRVIVMPADGKTIRGRVVSLVGGQLEIERQGWLKRERRMVTEPSVRRIALRDSTANGAAIGAAIGALVPLVLLRRPLPCEPYCYVLLIPMGTGALAGASLGSLIDAAINRTIYTSKQGVGVTVSPLLGPQRLGLTARIRFRE